MNINFEKYADGLAPAIVQDAAAGRVLMLGFMDGEALAETLSSGRVTFYSRSKRRLWTKGETSGHHLDVVSVTPDCDADTLLIKARPHGPACHTGAATCFGEPNRSDNFLYELEAVIESRRNTPESGSYVSKLFGKGMNKIAQKVGEEAVETVIAAKDDDPAAFKSEVADLLFHMLVLLNAKGVSLDEIVDELRGRHRQPRKKNPRAAKSEP